MGCGSSAVIYAKEDVAEEMTDDHDDVMGLPSAYERSEVWVREWKLLRSAVDARLFYEEDGSLPPNSKTGHLELRGLLDDPASYQLIISFAASKGKRIALSCWTDIQTLKKTPQQYCYKKGVILYLKYIKNYEDSELSNVVVTTEEERKETINFFEPKGSSSKSTEQLNEIHKDATVDEVVGCFLWLQLKCFRVVYEQIFLLFRLTPEYKEMSEMLKYRVNQVVPEDFEYIQKLGNGAFGIVIKCRKVSTGRVCAMKLQRKKALLQHFDSEPWRIDDEKKAYATCSHPFLVELFYAFQTKSLAIVVMDLVTCGDLSTVISSSKTPNNPLDHQHVLFYSAEVVSALAYLHELGLIYRDLKPGNILLHEDGHIKLADLGAVVDVVGDTIGQYDEAENMAPIFKKFSEIPTRRKKHDLSCTTSRKAETSATYKIIETPPGVPANRQRPRAKSIVGTIGYMAPEVLIQCSLPPVEHRGYTDTVDWWSLGSTIYKMYTGERAYVVREKDAKALRKRGGEISISDSDNEKPGKTVEKKEPKPGVGVRGKDVDSMSKRSQKKVNIEGSSSSSMNGTASMNSSLHQLLGEKEDSAHIFGTYYLPQQLQRGTMYETEGKAKEIFAYKLHIFSNEAVELLRGLLHFDEDKRLGSGPKGAVDVMSHAYFKGIDWKALERKAIPPPSLPSSSVPIELAPSSSMDNNKSLNKMPIFNALNRSSSPKPTHQTHDSLEDLLIFEGNGEWFSEEIQDDENQYFNNWDMVSTTAIEEEIASEKKKEDGW